MFDRIAYRYDFLNRCLSLGIDIYWRKVLRKNLPQNRTHLQVVDLATGTADVALELAKDQKVAQVLGLDLSEGMLEIGRQKIRAGKFDQVTLKTGDGVDIPLESMSCDVVTISFGIRNFPDVQRSLENCHRVLRRGGRLLVLELSVPTLPIVRQAYLFYFRHILPSLGKWLSKDPQAYTYLNKTVEDFPSGERFAKLLKDAGFQHISYRPLTLGIATLYIGDRVES